MPNYITLSEAFGQVSGLTSLEAFHTLVGKYALDIETKECDLGRDRAALAVING